MESTATEASTTATPGRPRQHTDNAHRQAAYRERLRLAALERERQQRERQAEEAKQQQARDLIAWNGVLAALPPAVADRLRRRFSFDQLARVSVLALLREIGPFEQQTTIFQEIDRPNS